MSDKLNDFFDDDVEDGYFYETNDNDDNENEDFDEENIEENKNIIDNSIITFSQHKQSVFTCDLSKNEKLAACGSQDDTACVWSTETGNLVFQCYGHKDSVISAKFNCNDKYLATGDMSGIIKIWLVENGNCLKEFYYEELTWIEWHPLAENIFLYGTQNSESNLIRFTDSYENYKVMVGQTPACFGTFLKDGKKSIVGYENGYIKIWDLKEGSVSLQIIENDKENILTSLSVNSENTLIAAGFLNSQIKLFKLATGECILKIEENFEIEENSVETFAFCDALQLLVVGFVDGTIQIWDINIFVKRDLIKLEEGVTKIVFDKNYLYLFYVSSLDGIIRLYDVRDSKLLNEFTGHSEQILDLVVGKNYFLSCSEDATCKLFSIK